MNDLPTDLSTIKEYILVHVDGNVRFNVEGIVSMLMDRTAFKYPCLEDRLTILHGGLVNRQLKFGEKWTFAGKKNINHYEYASSFLYLSLNEMVKYARCEGDWYQGKWERFDFSSPYRAVIDTVYYDEFIFLTAEGLIQFDRFTPLTCEDIWQNFIRSDAKIDGKVHKDILPLYEAKTFDELKKTYRRLMIDNHPDRNEGVHNPEFIDTLVHTFATLRKAFCS